MEKRPKNCQPFKTSILVQNHLKPLNQFERRQIYNNLNFHSWKVPINYNLEEFINLIMKI